MKSPAVCSRRSFFPRFNINEVDPVHLQERMCACFEQWGLPKSIKVDNGKPFGDPQRSSVPVLALWLITLDVNVIWNRPRNPRDNAKVERMQGTTSRWAEIQDCCTYTQLQNNLDKAAQLQREHYQVKRLGYQSRKQCYPDLWNNTRKYSRQSFDINRLDCYLSQVIFVRKVNNSGVFNFYSQCVYLGYSHRGKTVSLRYDPKKKQFMIEDSGHGIIACLAADNFSSENIEGLSVCQRKYVKCCNFMSH